MNKAKHTPGPWHLNAYNLSEVIIIREDPDAKGREYVDGRHQERVAMVGTENSAPWAERHANARLIVSAPKMLDALVAVLKAHDDELKHRGTVYTDGEAIRKLIAEATGV